jgi:hypothetical protein
VVSLEIFICYFSIFPIFNVNYEQSKRVQLKKKLGYRDESKYKMGAGDGANQKYKRQG